MYEDKIDSIEYMYDKLHKQNDKLLEEGIITPEAHKEEYDYLIECEKNDIRDIKNPM